MDEDFYIEESNPLKAAFTIIFVCLLVGAGIWTYYKYFPTNKLKLKDVTVELGEKVSDDINDYATGNTVGDYSLDISSVHTDENGLADSAGEYSYRLKNGTNIVKGKLYVKDTKAPNVEVEELTVGVNEEFDPSEFVIKCDDLSLPCKTEYKNSSDEKLNAKEGDYSLKIIVSDSYDNEVTKDVKLKVSSTETLLAKKQNDFIPVSPEDKEWNNTYTYKFDKCVSDESADYESAVSEVSSKEIDSDKEVSERSLIVIYNKYNYVIGFSVKLNFTDGTILFVTE